MSSNILVIDDDELVARTLQRALKMLGYQVSVALSGTEGIAVGAPPSARLFILDVVMPGADGYQVCRQIRGDPLLPNCPSSS
jgi:CheY-like chemotaxis protein